MQMLFDDVESIIGAIMAKDYPCTQEHGYCKILLLLCKNFEDEHNKLEDICKEIMKEKLFSREKKISIKFFQ